MGGGGVRRTPHPPPHPPPPSYGPGLINSHIILALDVPQAGKFVLSGMDKGFLPQQQSFNLNFSLHIPWSSSYFFSRHFSLAVLPTAICPSLNVRNVY